MKTALLDVGGTKIKSCIYDSEKPLTIKSIYEHATPSKLGGEAVIAFIENMLLFEKDLSAIAICTAGQVNPQDGHIIFSTKNIPGYTGMQIKNRLESRFQIPVFVENDVNAAAIGEANYGAGRELDDFLCVNYGTGIGGAIFINRSIFYGCSFSSGEFGHLITHSGGKECTCGNRGCYEAYASTAALIEVVLQETQLLLSGRDIFALFPNNVKIQLVVDCWIDEVLAGLSSLIHIFNPHALILGGGIMEQDYVIKSVQKKISHWLMPNYQCTSICKAKLGNIAGLTGMLHIASQALNHTLNMEKIHDK